MMDETQSAMGGGGGGDPVSGPVWSGGAGDSIPSDGEISVDAIQSAMTRVIEIGSCTHLTTLLSVAVCDDRVRHGEQTGPVTPRTVRLVRRQLSGTHRTTTAVRNSMNRLAAQGFVEKRDLEPGSRRRRFDWRLGGEGTQLLRVTNLVQFVRRVAEMDLTRSTDERLRAVTTAVDDLSALDSMVHLPTIVSIAALEVRDISPINGPRVVHERMRVDGSARSERSMYRSIDEVVEQGHVEKIDLEPDSDRVRFDLQLTERGWRLLHTTGAIDMVREYVRLTESPTNTSSN